MKQHSRYCLEAMKQISYTNITYQCLPRRILINEASKVKHDVTVLM